MSFTHELTQGEIRIAKRITTIMKDVAQQEVDMVFFQGLGLALACVFEECTGRSAHNAKPIDIMQWADNLPNTPMPRVSLT